MKETIKIEGMGCNHCVEAVEKELKALNGVAVEEVVIGEATVSYDPATTSRTSIDEAIVEAGYIVAVVAD